MNCVGCDKEPKSAQKLGRGWHRIGEEVHCPKCWTKAYRMRAISFGILGPAEDADGEWTKDDMYADLREAWKHSTRATNIATQQLAIADQVRMPSDKKLAPFKPPYIYPMLRAAVPELSSGSVSAIIHAATLRYLRRRLETVWFSSASFPNARYPSPYLVRRQDWKCGMTGKNMPVVSFRLGGQRRGVMLKTAGCGRQLSVFRRIVSGELQRAELAVYRKGKHAMVKMCYWRPTRVAPRDSSGTLLVRTGAHALLTAAIAGLNSGADPWVYHADHLRKRIGWHEDRIQRLADDRKAECRAPRNRRRKNVKLVADVARRQKDWVDSQLSRAAMMLVRYASRRRVCALQLDMRDQSYAESFPWFQLRSAIEYRCEDASIDFCVMKDDASDEVTESCESSVAE